jgi:hypothetical protein
MIPSLRGVGRLHKRPKHPSELPILPDAPPPPPVVAPSINVAASANGGLAEASNFLTLSANTWPPQGTNNGDRKGIGWGGLNGGWNSLQNEVDPYVTVTFNTSRTINVIDVITLQDTYEAPITPTTTTTFTKYGVTAYTVQYWTGAAWQTIQGGAVSGNNLVWRRFSFPEVTTTKIKVICNAYLAEYARIVEIEAHSVGTITASPPELTITSPNAGTTYTSGQNVPVVFTAVPSTATGGLLTKLELYRGATLVTTDNNPTGTSFTLTDTAPANGTYTYSVIAYHDVSTFTTKTVAGIIVQAAPAAQTPGAGNFVETVNYLRSRGTLVLAKPMAENTTADLSLDTRNGRPVGIGAFSGIMAPGTAPRILGLPIQDFGYPHASAPVPYTGLPQVDTVIKPPGAKGSMRLDTPALGGGANTAGDWFTHFGSEGNRRYFLPGETFWIQFKYRMNSAQFNTNFQKGGGDGIHNPTAEKFFNITGGNIPGIVIGSSEIGKMVFQSNNQHKFPIVYHYLPGGGDNTLLEVNVPNTTDFDKQPGNDKPNACSFREYRDILEPAGKFAGAEGIPSGCYGFVADQWMTFKVRVEIGNRVSAFPNDPVYLLRVTCWIQYDFGAEHVWLDTFVNHQLDSSGNFGKIMFWSYQTDKSLTQDHPLSQCWFGELIVATENIPASALNPSASWRPAPGQVADISLNTLSSVGVDPDPTHVQSYNGDTGIRGTSAWCSWCELPDYGTLGAFGHMSNGGHFAYFGTGAYVFSLDTLMWERILDPAAVGDENWNALNYNRDTGTPGANFPNTAASSHTYQGHQPWYKEHGGGPQGSMCLLAQGSVGVGSGVSPGYGYFTVDADTGVSTRKNSIPPLQTPRPQHGNGIGQTQTWYDTNRGYHWRLEDQSFEMVRMDPRDGSYTKFWMGTTGGGVGIVHKNSLAFFCKSLDRLVLIKIDANIVDLNNPAIFKIYTADPANITAGWTLNSSTGYLAQDIRSEMSCVWCDDPLMNCAALFWAQNTFITYLTAPAAAGGTWTFSRESFTGIRVPNQQTGAGATEPHGTYNRMSWSKNRCFIWWAYPTAPVQAITPARMT